MPTVNVYNLDSEVTGQLELSDAIFGVPVKAHVLHEVVVYQLAKRRAGTAKTKGRNEIRGGGKKPWRQKGTGRARAGTGRSPIWRGGGTIHGPQPRDYDMRIPKKVRRMALKMALTQKVIDDGFKVIDPFKLDKIRTRDFVELLDRFELGKTLVVLPEPDEIIEKSARNIPNVKVLRSEGLNVYDLLDYHAVILSRDCVSRIEEALA